MARVSGGTLLCGFEPFGDLSRNPSKDVVLRLRRDRALRARGLVTAVLPVDRQRTPEALHALLGRHEPSVVILTGVAVGRPGATVERIAVNCWRRPGVGGAGRPIRRGGPDGLFTTLPLDAMVSALCSSGLEANISETAGTFACNLALYEGLIWARERRPDALVAFLHLPATPECLPMGRNEPTVALARLVRGVAGLVTVAGTWVGHERGTRR